MKSRGSLYDYFSHDHARLEILLLSTLGDDGGIHVEPFREFRSGILRHIYQEERLLLPAIQKGSHGRPFVHAARLRLEHGAVAALLVPSPSPETVRALRHIFAFHNPLEEDPNGLYDACEAAVGDNLNGLMAEVHAAPEIPTLPFNDDPVAMEAIKRAVGRAGYDFDAISRKP